MNISSGKYFSTQFNNSGKAVYKNFQQDITQECYISRTRADGELLDYEGNSYHGKGDDPFLKPSEYWKQGTWDESGKPISGNYASGRMLTGPHFYCLKFRLVLAK